MIIVGSLVTALVLGLGIYQSNASESAPKLTKNDIEQLVTNQYPGTIKELELEKSHNNYVYEVEIESDGKLYELDLDGNTGEILNLEESNLEKDEMVLEDANKEDGLEDHDVEKEDKDEVTPPEEKEDKNEVNSNTEREEKDYDKNNQHKLLDPKEAIDIALNKFQGTVKEIQLDSDNGRLLYEIEVISNHVEMEFEIDAHTGKILEEDRGKTKKNYDKLSVISAKDALDIAFSKFSGTLIELELEEDDGFLIYEIEIKSGREEAEIEINAYTGEVLFIEIDRD